MKKQVKPKIRFTGQKPNNNVLMAKIPTTLIGNKVSFPHRYSAIIDTGFDFECPEGYKLGVRIVSALSERGMIATNLAGGIKKGRIKVILLNVGREIVELKDGEPLAEIWLESDNEFELEEGL